MTSCQIRIITYPARRLDIISLLYHSQYHRYASRPSLLFCPCDARFSDQSSSTHSRLRNVIFILFSPNKQRRGRGGKGVRCQAFSFVPLFLFSRPRAGLATVWSGSFRVGNQYAECEKQQQQQHLSSLVNHYQLLGVSQGHNERGYWTERHGRRVITSVYH